MIYYFSATGNTLSLVKKIAQGTDDSLCPMGKVTAEQLEGDVIGLAFPVFYGDVPKNVISFLKNHTFPENAYIYGVATCGETYGRVFTTLRKLVEAQGSQLACSFVFKSIANSTIAVRSHIPYAWPKLAKEDAAAEAISKAVNERKKDHSLEGSSLIAGFYFSGLGQAFDRWYFGLSVDPKLCVKCGLCASLCPMKNITIGQQGAQIGKNCLHCLACIHHCPKQAIMVRGKHILKEDQYNHPGIIAAELKR